MVHVSHIVNSVFSSRTYILSRDGSTGLTTGGSNDVWLVDCGDIEQLPADIRVIGVLLTHTHSDHIYGLNKLIERFPDVRIVTNGYGAKALYDPRLNISAYHSEYEDFVLNASARVEVEQEGSTVDVLGQELRVFETPGHDPSCLCFEVDGRLFTGDAHIPGVKVFTGFPKSEKKLAIASEQRILSIVSNLGLDVYPGHEV